MGPTEKRGKVGLTYEKLSFKRSDTTKSFDDNSLDECNVVKRCCIPRVCVPIKGLFLFMRHVFRPNARIKVTFLDSLHWVVSLGEEIICGGGFDYQGRRWEALEYSNEEDGDSEESDRCVMVQDGRKRQHYP